MLEELHSALAYTEARFCDTPSVGIIYQFIRELAILRDEAQRLGSLAEFKSACRSHPIFDVIHQDPYSRRAYEKPKGYAGDAIMLDYIYRPREVATSALGAVVHKATTQLSNAQSILFRRDYLASLMTGVVERQPNADVLSVASGHMRELDTFQSKTANRSLRILALDQDSESLNECIKSYPEFNIKALNKSIIALLKQTLISERQFDLIYSAGLADYLSDKTLQCMLGRLYQHLKPDGLITIANYTPDSHGRGFMEGFMDWSLIYRDEDDLARIVRTTLPAASYRVFRDDPGNVAYIEIRSPRFSR